MISIWAFLKHKRQFSGHLAEYPLLRVLIFSIWFRLACVAFILLSLFLITMLPRIWRVTPSDFAPEYRISGIDAIQAWSLGRSAHKSMQSGKTEEGMISWKMCLANNPANLTHNRQLLNDFLLYKPDNHHNKFAVQQSLFLLRLSNTNLLDVELVVRLYEHLNLHSLIEKLLEPMSKNLNPVLATSYLKSLFQAGNYERFSEFASTREAMISKDPILEVYHAAYISGWGEAGRITAAREKLEAAKNNGANQVLAHKLQLSVSFQTKDLDGYAKSLNKLVLMREDTPLQHAQHWLLMLSLGKKDMAIKEAQSYPFPPTSPQEAIIMSNAYYALGLKEMAIQLTQRFIRVFADDAELWITHANLLMSNQSWDSLAAVGLEIRQNSSYFPVMESYGYLLEALASHHQRRYDAAEQSLASMLKCRIFDPSLGCSMAELALKSGYPRQARELLEKIKSLKPNPLAYWTLLFSVANELRDEQLLYTAAETVYDMYPQNWIVKNNYAAALIILRKRPELAVKLTLPFLVNYPEAHVSKINHALALMQNERFGEAEPLLKSINISRLNDNEKSAFNLAMVELLISKKEYESAKGYYKLLNTNHLFPSENNWLREAGKLIFPTNNLSSP